MLRRESVFGITERIVFSVFGKAPVDSQEELISRRRLVDFETSDVERVFRIDGVTRVSERAWASSAVGFVFEFENAVSEPLTLVNRRERNKCPLVFRVRECVRLADTCRRDHVHDPRSVRRGTVGGDEPVVEQVVVAAVTVVSGVVSRLLGDNGAQRSEVFRPDHWQDLHVPGISVEGCLRNRHRNCPRVFIDRSSRSDLVTAPIRELIAVGVDRTGHGSIGTEPVVPGVSEVYIRGDVLFVRRDRSPCGSWVVEPDNEHLG